MWSTTRKLILRSELITSMSADECINVECIQPVFQQQGCSNSTYDSQLHQNYQLRPSTDAEAVWQFTVVGLHRRVISWGCQVFLLDSQRVVTPWCSSNGTAEIVPVWVMPVIAHLTNSSFNYRPISNKSTISKIVERLVMVRFLASGNFNSLQLTYAASPQKQLYFLWWITATRPLTRGRLHQLRHVCCIRHHQSQHSTATSYSLEHRLNCTPALLWLAQVYIRRTSSKRLVLLLTVKWQLQLMQCTELAIIIYELWYIYAIY